eukprot:TRINITY_DN20120_c0_g1_i1.p1 TRINITY_DN20120_c0_g1~~TRINITY_DN20120_c0_g1_i1.p1  ORF type:complete len:969 (+),score=237.42 TRINITY_DN20120_c0_g1_i1:80-2908(+)
MATVNFLTAAGELVRMSAGQGTVLEEIWRNEEWELVGFGTEMYYDQDTRLLMDQDGIGGNLPADKADEIVPRLRDLCDLCGVPHTFPTSHKYPPSPLAGDGDASIASPLVGRPHAAPGFSGGHPTAHLPQQPAPPLARPFSGQHPPQQPHQQVEYTSPSGEIVRLCASPHGLVEYVKRPDEHEFKFAGVATELFFTPGYRSLVDQDNIGALLPEQYLGALLWRVKLLCDGARVRNNIAAHLGDVLDLEQANNAALHTDANLHRSGSPRSVRSRAPPSPISYFEPDGVQETAARFGHGDRAAPPPQEQHQPPSVAPQQPSHLYSPRKDEVVAALDAELYPVSQSTAGNADGDAESTRWREYDLPLFPKGETSLTTGPRRHFTADKWITSPDFNARKGPPRRESARPHGGRGESNFSGRSGMSEAGRESSIPGSRGLGEDGWVGSKALIIGPNETKQGTVEKSVKRLHDYLRRHNSDIPVKVLDTQRPGPSLLHRAELLQALDWLTQGTQAGDVLFLGIVGMSYSVAGAPGIPLTNNDKFTAHNWQEYFQTLPSGLLVNIIADVTPTAGLFELPFSCMNTADGGYGVQATSRYVQKYEGCEASIVALQCGTRSFSPEDTVLGAFMEAVVFVLEGKRDPPTYKDLLMSIRKVMLGKGIEIQGVSREASQSLYPILASNEHFDATVARFEAIPWQTGLLDGMDKQIPGLDHYGPDRAAQQRIGRQESYLRAGSHLAHRQDSGFPGRRAHMDAREGQGARRRIHGARPHRPGMVDPTTESFMGQVSGTSDGLADIQRVQSRISATPPQAPQQHPVPQRETSKDRLEAFKRNNRIHLDVGQHFPGPHHSPRTQSGAGHPPPESVARENPWHPSADPPPPPPVPIEPRVFDEVREALTRIYTKHNPGKIPEIPSLILEYNGRYQVMLEVMSHKYHDADVLNEYRHHWGP